MVRKRLSDKATTPTQRLIIFVLVVALVLILAYSQISRVRTLFVLRKPMYIESVIQSGKGLKLQRPLGLASTSDRIYVADAITRQISVFDTDGNYLFGFGKKELAIPVYLTADKDGYVYVTDRYKKAVLKFNDKGRFITNFASKYLKNPLGIASDEEDNIYVTDIAKEHRVLVFSHDGTLKKAFGKKKRADNAAEDGGFFYYPNDIAVQSRNNQTVRIYVADSNNHRVQVFDAGGNFKAAIATGGLPRGLAFNNKLKNLFVVDGLGHKVLVYDDSGNYKFSFGKQGRGEGSLLYPNDVTLLGKNQDDIYITDRQNMRVQLFSANITPRRLWILLRPYAKYLPLPFFFLLLLFVASRKKKYIVSDCFLNEVLAKGRLDDFIIAKKLYHITPLVSDFLEKENLVKNFENRLKTNRRVSESLIKKVQETHKVSRKHAELLALGYKRGIYHPVILACDDKLMKTAHDMGIETHTTEQFFENK